MIRLSRLVAMLVAVVMTAFTFGLMDQSAGPRSDVQAMTAAGYLLSAMHLNSGVLVRDRARI